MVWPSSGRAVPWSGGPVVQPGPHPFSPLPFLGLGPSRLKGDNPPRDPRRWTLLRRSFPLFHPEFRYVFLSLGVFLWNGDRPPKVRVWAPWVILGLQKQRGKATKQKQSINRLADLHSTSSSTIAADRLHRTARASR